MKTVKYLAIKIEKESGYIVSMCPKELAALAYQEKEYAVQAVGKLNQELHRNSSYKWVVAKAKY